MSEPFWNSAGHSNLLVGVLIHLPVGGLGMGIGGFMVCGAFLKQKNIELQIQNQ